MHQSSESPCTKSEQVSPSTPFVTVHFLFKYKVDLALFRKAKGKDMRFGWGSGGQLVIIYSKKVPFGVRERENLVEGGRMKISQAANYKCVKSVLFEILASSKFITTLQ